MSRMYTNKWRRNVPRALSNNVINIHAAKQNKWRHDLKLAVFDVMPLTLVARLNIDNDTK